MTYKPFIYYNPILGRETFNPDFMPADSWEKPSFLATLQRREREMHQDLRDEMKERMDKISYLSRVFSPFDSEGKPKI